MGLLTTHILITNMALMNKQNEKQSVYAILVIGISLIVLGLTIGQMLEPILYTFIPLGLILQSIALIRIRKMRKR